MHYTKSYRFKNLTLHVVVDWGSNPVKSKTLKMSFTAFWLDPQLEEKA